MEGGRAAARANRLGSFEVEIDYDGVLTAADDDGFTGLVGVRVDLLVRDVWGHVNEIAGPGFTGEFQVVAPSHAGATANDVEDRFEFAVMMRPGFGVGLDDDGACPQFARARSSVGDGGCASHSGSLGSIGVQIARCDDFDAVMLPVHGFHDSVFWRQAS